MFVLRGILVAILMTLPVFAVAEEVADVPSIVVNAEGEVPSQDPIENWNRDVFDFNQGIDSAILKPVARGYRHAVPEWARDRVSNVLSALGEPNQFINSALQGDVESTFRSFWRFMINATFGIAGLYDVASEAGLAPTQKDFGQTLAKYGWDKTSYVVLPILGPNTSRDTVGLVFDSLTNPFHYLNTPVVVAKSVGGGIEARERLLDFTDEVNETSFDPYATFRSVYRQNRQQIIDEK